MKFNFLKFRLNVRYSLFELRESIFNFGASDNFLFFDFWFDLSRKTYELVLVHKSSGALIIATMPFILDLMTLQKRPER